MGVRSHHDVARGVGIEVEQDEVKAPSMQHQFLAVLRGVEGGLHTEQTALTLAGLAHVPISPGTPQVIHKFPRPPGGTDTPTVSPGPRRRGEEWTKPQGSPRAGGY